MSEQGVIRPPGAKTGIIEAVWKPEEDAKEAVVAAPAEVEGVKAVLAGETDGAKVVPAEAEADNDTPAAKEEAQAAASKVDEPKAGDA